MGARRVACPCLGTSSGSARAVGAHLALKLAAPLVCAEDICMACTDTLVSCCAEDVHVLHARRARTCSCPLSAPAQSRSCADDMHVAPLSTCMCYMHDVHGHAHAMWPRAPRGPARFVALAMEVAAPLVCRGRARGPARVTSTTLVSCAQRTCTCYMHDVHAQARAMYWLSVLHA